MRRRLILGVFAELSTFNSNFSKAEIRTEIWIYRFNNYQMYPRARSTLTHELLEELNSTIPTLPGFLPRRRFLRSWGSELTIQSEDVFAISWTSWFQGARTGTFEILVIGSALILRFCIFWPKRFHCRIYSLRWRRVWLSWAVPWSSSWETSSSLSGRARQRSQSTRWRRRGRWTKWPETAPGSQTSSSRPPRTCQSSRRRFSGLRGARWQTSSSRPPSSACGCTWNIRAGKNDLNNFENYSLNTEHKKLMHVKHSCWKPIYKPFQKLSIMKQNIKKSFRKLQYSPITYYWTVPLILDHSYLVGKFNKFENCWYKSVRILELSSRAFVSLIYEMCQVPNEIWVDHY